MRREGGRGEGISRVVSENILDRNMNRSDTIDVSILCVHIIKNVSCFSNGARIKKRGESILPSVSAIRFVITVKLGYTVQRASFYFIRLKLVWILVLLEAQVSLFWSL